MALATRKVAEVAASLPKRDLAYVVNGFPMTALAGLFPEYFLELHCRTSLLLPPRKAPSIRNARHRREVPDCNFHLLPQILVETP